MPASLAKLTAKHSDIECPEDLEAKSAPPTPACLRHYRARSPPVDSKRKAYTQRYAPKHTGTFHSLVITACTTNAPGFPQSRQPVFHSLSTHLSTGCSVVAWNRATEAIHCYCWLDQGLLRGACHRRSRDPLAPTRRLTMTVCILQTV